VPVMYKNRKGDSYYLHKGTTKKGKPKYYFSQKKDGDLVEEIPEGYEIYEHPNSQVFLRKSRSRIFRDKEIFLVEDAIKESSDIKYWRIDIRDDAIVIFTPIQNVEGVRETLSTLFASDEEIGDTIKRVLDYSPEVRFKLQDSETREFSAERMAYFGGEREWWALEYSQNLKKLARKYCPHLGKESLFEFV
jgi:hypothetical protein